MTLTISFVIMFAFYFWLFSVWRRKSEYIRDGWKVFYGILIFFLGPVPALILLYIGVGVDDRYHHYTPESFVHGKCIH